MKMAIVHDYLCGIGGSERVFQYICEEFFEADVFTLAYHPSKTLPYFSSRKINTTWLNRLVRTPEMFRWSFPIATYTMRKLDLSKYQLVLSSSATTAKYVSVLNGKHICYCYIPTRALWHFEEYFKKGLKSQLIRPFLNYLRKQDYNAAQKIDRFIAISEASKTYISRYYKRDAEIIYCPIETEKFHPSRTKKDHYLIVSRLEHWKRVDYAIEAFNRLQLPLKIIGTGAEEKKLRAMANPKYITFLGEVDDDTLAHEYGECRAVIFTPFLEYGLIPLEANASGTPVICYGKGGITETMIPDDDSGDKKPTAVFFYEQSADSLIKAVKRFESLHFDVSDLVNHAAKWSVSEFKKQIRNQINVV